MAILSNIKTSLGNILTSKMRSTLTLLGILVGTGSVVALLSIGQLATQHALAQFKTLGTSLLAVTIQDKGQTSEQQQLEDKLSLADVAMLAKSKSEIENIAPYTLNFQNIYFRGNKIGSNIMGVNQAMHQIAKLKLQAGRFVADVDGFTDYAVLGYKTAQKTGLSAKQLIGRQISLGSEVFTVVGVLKKWPQSLFVMSNINDAVMVPIKASFLLSKYSAIENLLFKLQTDANIPKVKNALTDEFNSMLTSKKLFFRSAEELISSMKKQQRTFTLLLGAIGGISLLVGGIGVMNIMLVSVVERRREIGVRMAIGAKRKDIRVMFLTEAVLLTIFGGLLGIVIGILASFITAEISQWGFQIFIFPPVIGFLVSMLVGIFFGLYPAYKASKLDPITCLHAE